MKTINQAKRRKRLTGIIIGSALMGIGIAVLLAILLVVKIIKGAPDILDMQIHAAGNEVSTVYDEAGNLIDKFSGTESREYAYLEKMPKQLRQAVIAIEDKNFYKHNGMDLFSVGKALMKNLKSGNISEGGTTITGQVIKHNLLPASNPIERKIQEQYLAIQFEKLYSKDLILEYYLNSVTLGHGANGVQAAALRYFGKDVSELNLTECAVLTAIIEFPTRYSPILYPDNNWEKVQVILGEMEKQGYITETEKIEALKLSPYERVQSVHQEILEKAAHSYFIDEVYKQVVADLQEQKGMSKHEAQGMLYGGGLRIDTTLDSNMQALVDKYLNDEAFYPENLYKVRLDYQITGIKADGTSIKEAVYGKVVDRLDEIEAFKAAMKTEWQITEEDQIQKEVLISQPQPQAAFVVTDYRTGQVKALYGGRGDKQPLSFNYATQALRLPGCTFKVLAAYAPGIDQGLYTPESTFSDEKFSVEVSQGNTYTPRNLSGTYTNQPMSLKDALAQSNNAIAMRTVYEGVGLDITYDYLKAFGFKNLTEEDKTWALPLGGLTHGVSTLELNGAYGAIANHGVYIQPTFYTKVIDRSGNIILDAQSEASIKGRTHTVLKRATAASLTQMLQYSANEETGESLEEFLSTMPVAGKINLSGDNKDLFFAGYTPYYAATIWSGYSNPEKLEGHDYYQVRLWAKMMHEIHKRYEYQGFEEELK